MKSAIYKIVIFVCAGIFCAPTAVRAENLDEIGVTVLRVMTTNLNGTTVRVGQVEASAPPFEVNPTAVGQPTNLFTWIATTTTIVSIASFLPAPSTATNYPNAVGTESGHANAVGKNFYGIPDGVATNVAHVNNYDAETFYYHYVYYNNAITDRIVNQSFTFGTNDDSISQNYDDYAAQRNVLFVNGAGFPGNPVWSPATSYNGIGVGVFDNPDSPYGPTIDGRSKPDITAPYPSDAQTSYATPYVAGTAALLLQAAARGDGGSNTNAAADIRTLKALLLNGAVKPIGWTNSPTNPLHSRYGAGLVNAFNSYEQLVGGRQVCIVSNTVSLNAAHPPTGATGTVSVLSGWDFNTNTSSSLPTAKDAVNHYYFNVTNNAGSTSFTATATLVWNRQQSQSSINNLNLFLYNCANSNLVACSTSLVDNVEHIYQTNLAQGRYDLQVWKAGGSYVSASEPYALAFEFVSASLALTKSGTNVNLTWPVYPAGFLVEARPDLITGAWITNNLPAAIVTNGQNSIPLNATNAAQFFRLRQPNF